MWVDMIDQMLDVVLEILDNGRIRVELLHEGIDFRRVGAADVDPSEPQETKLSSVVVVLERSACGASEADGVVYVVVHQGSHDAQTVLTRLEHGPIDGNKGLLVVLPERRHKTQWVAHTDT